MNTRSYRRITVSEASMLLQEQSATLLDCRHPGDFRKGHIKGAAALGDYNAQEYIHELPKQQPLLIYCYRGNASQVYAQLFIDFGFQQVYSLDGGYEAWCGVHGSVVGQLSEELQLWLAKQGFPVDEVHACTRDGVTPLMRAAGEGNAELVADLLAAGADPNRCNHDGNQALWLACVSEDLVTVDLLVAAGANIDHQNQNGATCLMYAASAGKTSVVEHLLELGADRSLLSLDDFSALDMAANRECLDLLRAPRKQKINQI